MQKINKLLVVIEPELMESLALKRAKQIAEKTKAALHLLICDKEDKPCQQFHLRKMMLLPMPVLTAPAYGYPFLHF